MSEVLFINACVRGERSRTLALARRFLAEYAAAHPGDRITERDLTADRLTPQYPEVLSERDELWAAGRLEQLLAGVRLPRDHLLLIAPPPLARGAWVRDAALIGASRAFARCCRTLAERLGIHFADAGAWVVPLAYDGVHFTEQGHRAFAAGLLGALGRGAPASDNGFHKERAE